MSSAGETQKHIDKVEEFIDAFVDALWGQSRTHDKSKLFDPELAVFNEFTPKLKGLTYGSEEYKACLVAMKPALDHHYAHNRHHPEHFQNHVCNGCFKVYTEKPLRCEACGYSQFQTEPDVSQMNLVDLVEMFCDWKAAALRHQDGDIFESIKINAERFKIDPQLVSILMNSAKIPEGDKDEG